MTAEMTAGYIMIIWLVEMTAGYNDYMNMVSWDMTVRWRLAMLWLYVASWDDGWDDGWLYCDMWL